MVLADFLNDEPGVNNLGDPLALAFQQQNISFIRVHHVEADREQAQQDAHTYNATIVVWGEKYSTGVQVNYEIEPPYSQIESTVNDLLIAVDDHFSTFVINEAMGVPYLIDFTQGQMLYFNGDYAHALDAFNAAVQRIPSGREAEAQAAALYFDRGNTFYILNMKDDALADYNHALALDPNDEKAYYNRGNVYHNQGQDDRALADYNHALALDPNDENAYVNRGTVYHDHGQDNQALEDFNHALDLDPNDENAYYNRGAVYQRQGQDDLALADYNHALALDPNDENAYVNRGAVYQRQGQDDRALEDYNHALDLDPNFAQAYNNRGIIYMNQGQDDAALTDFTHALDLDPNFANAYGARGVLYFVRHDYERALADYQTYQRLTGHLEPFMQEQIAEMQPALTATARAQTATPPPLDSLTS